MANSEWLVLFTVIVTSFAVCAAILLTKHWHGWLSLDDDMQGIQKIHDIPVPRVGGVGIALGLITGGLGLIAIDQYEAGMTTLLLMACAIPTFAAGFLEDITKGVSVRNRLIASFASGALGLWLVDAQLLKLDTPGLDMLMAFTPAAMLFTCFAVGGVTNAINIIDGLNGLASGSVTLMLGGLAAMAWIHGDNLVAHLCLIGMATMIGFMLLNYPAGHIFLGDGGAYLSGFWLAECAVLLLSRNPSISTWAALLACLYPVWETAFSMFRRHVVKRVSSGQPDMAHFHHMALHRVVTPLLGSTRPTWVKHGLSSLLCYMLVLPCQIIAIANTEDTAWLVVGGVAFVLTYQWLYASMRKIRDWQGAEDPHSAAQSP